MKRLAILLAAFALPASPAAAMPIDPVTSPASDDGGVRVVRVTEAGSDELDWGDAGIGAAGTAALLGLAGCLVAAGRGRRPAR
jgi:hypothetical protein